MLTTVIGFLGMTVSMALAWCIGRVLIRRSWTPIVELHDDPQPEQTPSIGPWQTIRLCYVGRYSTGAMWRNMIETSVTAAGLRMRLTTLPRWADDRTALVLWDDLRAEGKHNLSFKRSDGQRFNLRLSRSGHATLKARAGADWPMHLGGDSVDEFGKRCTAPSDHGKLFSVRRVFSMLMIVLGILIAGLVVLFRYNR